MRIGIDLRLHAYAPGGISYYARQLSLALAPLLPAGTLTLLQHRREREPVSAPGVRSVRAWTPPHHRLEQLALGAELWPLRLDVWHSTDFIPPAWGARRMVATIHDLNFLYYPQYLTSEARRYYNDQIRQAVSRADALLADSYATQRDLETMLGVPPARVTVVHLAADPAFRPLPAAATQAVLTRYGLEAGYVLFVGTWEPRKNLAGLLEALANLHARGERRRLVIAGRPGWLYEEVFARVRALGLEPWVRFIERLPTEDLVALYNGAIALALPSFYEGFGLPALEALHCGTPVVAADRASLPEVVGEAGVLINPEDSAALADALLAVIQDPARREQLRAAGLVQARHFTWEAAARATLEVYTSLVI